MNIGFNLKSPGSLALNERVSLFFEVRHLLPVSSYESPRWHLLSIEDFLICIELLLFRVAACINYLS